MKKSRLAMIAAVVVLVAAPLVAWAVFKPRRHNRDPRRPEKTTRLVTSGIHRYSRNPMYLGHAAMLLALALYLANAVAFLALPAFVLFVSRFQIRAEERYLAARFPDAYAACAVGRGAGCDAE